MQFFYHHESQVNLSFLNYTHIVLQTATAIAVIFLELSKDTHMAKNARIDDITKRLASVNAEDNANNEYLIKKEAIKTFEMRNRTDSTMYMRTNVKK